MNITELITKAKETSGLTLGQMAAELEVKPSTLSAWKKGDYKPGPTDIVYLADKANLPVFEVLAEIETESHPSMAGLWKKVVSHLRQNEGKY